MRLVLLGSFAESLVNFRGSLLRALVAEGHEVHALAPEITDTIAQKLAAWGIASHSVKLHRTGVNPLKDLQSLISLVHTFRHLKPDYVLTYTIKPNIWGSFAAKLNGVKSAAMVTGLGYAFTDTGPAGFKQKIVRALVKRLYRLATSFNKTVYFQNPDDLNDFVDTGCLSDSGKVVMVNGSGVDIDHFAVSPLPKKPVFTMIARLLHNKGVREFCAAANMVQANHRDARFVLIGPYDSGPDAIKKEELASWTGSAVEYVGPLEDVRPALAQCSTYVLPSYREGTPRSVLEAMACGRPIITSDAPGCRETVDDGVNGFLVPVGDAKGIAAAMETLLTDASLCDKFGKASRQIAEEKYAVGKVNAQVIKGLVL